MTCSGVSASRTDFMCPQPFPAQFEKITLDQFLQGRVEPPIVIEIGLDYGLKHLDGDIDKLRTSRVPHPYVIHLSRIGPRVEAVEDRINGIATSAPGLRAAYVHHGTGGVAVKRLNDSAVSPRLPRTQGIAAE
jgi:hypothetical protein